MSLIASPPTPNPTPPTPAFRSTQSSRRIWITRSTCSTTGGARISDMRKKLERGSVCHLIPPPPTPDTQYTSLWRPSKSMGNVIGFIFGECVGTLFCLFLKSCNYFWTSKSNQLNINVLLRVWRKLETTQFG